MIRKIRGGDVRPPASRRSHELSLRSAITAFAAALQKLPGAAGAAYGQAMPYPDPSCRVRLRSGHTLDVLTDMTTTSRLLFGNDDGDDAHDRGFAGLITRGPELHDVYPGDVVALEPL